MIELPEALTLAKQLNEAVAGKTVSRVLPPSKPHKFCWFNGDAANYEEKIKGMQIIDAAAFGIYVEIGFENDCRLCINDGVNVRLVTVGNVPDKYQLVIAFTDNTALVFTVAMYGGIVLHDGSYDNEYYLKSKAGISPFSEDFLHYFDMKFAESKPKLSAKAFLATEQRFPGIGNGTAQDILFAAGINPKRKIETFTKFDADRLRTATVATLRIMTDCGGRDTEKDIYGQTGGYVTKMSKTTVMSGCPICGGDITKESYLGGSVYYCVHCQPL